MKKKILLSLLALVLGVPAVALLSGAVPAQKTATVRSSFETKKEIAYKLYGRIKIVMGKIIQFALPVLLRIWTFALWRAPNTPIAPGIG